MTLSKLIIQDRHETYRQIKASLAVKKACSRWNVDESWIYAYNLKKPAIVRVGLRRRSISNES